MNSQECGPPKISVPDDVVEAVRILYLEMRDYDQHDMSAARAEAAYGTELNRKFSPDQITEALRVLHL